MKNKMGMKPIPKDYPQAKYVAYIRLRELQEKKKSWLTREEIYLELQTTIPYLTSQTGTTLEDSVKILEKDRIVKYLGEDRFYIPFEN